MCNNVNKICTNFHKNLPEQNIEKWETIVNYSCLQKNEKTGKKIRPKPIKCVHISMWLPMDYDWEMIGGKTTASANIDEKWYVKLYTLFFTGLWLFSLLFLCWFGNKKKSHKSFQNTTFPDAIYAKCLCVTRALIHTMLAEGVWEKKNWKAPL